MMLIGKLFLLTVLSFVESKDIISSRLLFIEDVEFHYTVTEEDHALVKKQILLKSVSLNDIHIMITQKFSSTDLRQQKDATIYSLKTSIEQNQKNYFRIKITLFNETNKAIAKKIESPLVDKKNLIQTLDKALTIVFEELKKP